MEIEKEIASELKTYQNKNQRTLLESTKLDLQL